MMYPSMAEVETADQEQLCRWVRFLPSPGTDAIGRCEFQEVLAREAPVMDRIVTRWKEGGGFTPELSKRIGWDKQAARL